MAYSKKRTSIYAHEERVEIIRNPKMVDNIAVCYGDAETNDARGAIPHVMSVTPTGTKVIFANGGDRKPGNVPEQDIYGEDVNVEFAWGVGGDNKKTPVGYYRNGKNPKLKEHGGIIECYMKMDPFKAQVKELTVELGQRLSMQRHEERSEHWFVSEGTAPVYTECK